MKFDLTNKSVDELMERQQLLSAEIPAEERDAMTAEEIEERGDELEAIKAELETREAAAKVAEETRQEVAEGNDPIIKTFEEKVEEKHMEKNSMEYRNLWLKIVSDKFFEKMKKLAPMLSEITLLRVAGNLKFVAEGVRNTASKHTENSAIAAAEDTIVNVTLGGFEFMKVIQISRTAKLMSVDAFEGWLVEMLAGDIARAIDNYIINDETNGIAALTWTTSTNQIVAANYGYGNVCDLIALLPAAYDAEAKFLVNKKTLYGKVAQIVDSTGNPIFVPDTVTGIGGRLMGYPVVADDYVGNTKDELYLGKWSDVVGNLPEDIHVDRDESAGFTSNSIMYRGIAVFDSKPAKGDGIVRLVSTTN